MLTITHVSLTHVGLISLVLVPGLCAAPAQAQCPDNIPASLVSSIQDPELRAAAMKSPRVDPTFVAQNGGLTTMIDQVRAQVEADRGWLSQETANQADLSRQGLGNDARARDGRRLMQTMREKQRLDEAYLRVLECHAGASGVASLQPPVRPVERAPGMDQRSTSLENAARQLEQVARATRDQALQNADPELIAFYAKQDALAAQRDANVAAAVAGQARGQREAREGALKDQVDMVTKVVRSWQAPRSYARRAAASGVTLEDPFAASAPATPDPSVLQPALQGTGLVWDDSRQVARIAVPASCGGRLQPGDYPVLSDGALLDTPDRIKAFLSVCADPAQPILVLRGEGELVVIK